jgi:DNA-binding CsgD family transcriptional regulator
MEESGTATCCVTTGAAPSESPRAQVAVQDCLNVGESRQRAAAAGPTAARGLVGDALLHLRRGVPGAIAALAGVYGAGSAGGAVAGSPPSSGRSPWFENSSCFAQRARLDITPPDPESVERNQDLEDLLGLTPRETEVLMLVARGYTNQEIADALVISVKTASVHVSHILRKLNAPNRREAAATAHRLAPPPRGERPEIDA